MIRRYMSRPGRIINRILFFIIILITLFYILFPFYWAVNSSVKPRSELFLTPVVYWPSHITWDHYKVVTEDNNFLRAFRNSVIVAMSTVLLSLVIGSFAAYALGRFKFRGRSVVLYSVLAMTTFPNIAILTGLFLLVTNPCIIVGASCPEYKLFNSPWALILTYLTFTLPLTVWILTAFFKSMPAELEQAAYVDGASPFQTFYKILLPLAAPGMVTTGLLAFIAAWNEFLFALMFTQDYDARTVPVAIALFSTGRGATREIPFGEIMAAAILVTIPIVIFVLIFQRMIIAGLTSGSVKG